MKILITSTAEKPPLFMWNRYPSGIIGAAIRVAARRQVSVVWGRPSYQPCCGRWGRSHFTHCRNHKEQEQR